MPRVGFSKQGRVGKEPATPGLPLPTLSPANRKNHYRHAYAACEWIRTSHAVRRRQDDFSEVGPERADIAAIPFFLVAEEARKGCCSLSESVARLVCIRSMRVSLHLREPCAVDGYHLAPPRRLSRFVGALSSIGALAAALSFQELPRAKSKDLAAGLAHYCKRATKLHLPDAYHQDRPYELPDGLRKSAAIALSLGLPTEAMTISLRAPHKRPRLWAFRDIFYNRDVFPFLFRVALRALPSRSNRYTRETCFHRSSFRSVHASTRMLQARRFTTRPRAESRTISRRRPRTTSRALPPSRLAMRIGSAPSSF